MTNWIGKRRVTDISGGPENEVNFAAGEWKIDGTAVTSSAAELNAIDISAAGTVQASKGVVVDANKMVDSMGVTKPLLRVYNGTGGALTQDDLVYLSGWDATTGLPKIVKADADATDAPAMFFVSDASIADASAGMVASRGLSAATLNTSAASAAGDPVYLDTTAGGWTLTAPTGANATVQEVGTVAVDHASTGQIFWTIDKPANKIGAADVQGTALVASTAAAKGDLYVATANDTVAVMTVGANGTSPVASSGATPGLAYAYPHIGGLTSMERASTSMLAATHPPSMVTGTGAMADGTLYLAGIYLPYAATITGVGFCLTTAGDTTADNENRIGIYTSDGTNLTLVASTTDDGTLWENSAGIFKKDLTSTYAAAAGRYWIGLLANWSAVSTAPVLAHIATANAGLTDCSMSDTDEVLACTVASQATLPASQAWSGVTGVAGYKFAFVY